MDEKFFVDYEALVYNMPACKGFEFLDHVFVVNNVTTEIEKIIKPDKEPLTMNFAFLNCVVNDEKGNNVFITVKNKITLEVLSDAESDEKLHKQIVDIVRRKMEAVEQHLILLQIFIYSSRQFKLVYVQRMRQRSNHMDILIIVLCYLENGQG